MRLPFTRPRAVERRVQGFTAAATSVDLSDPETSRRESARQRKRPLDWQRQAWNYHDELLEVRGPARWMADAQEKMRLFPAVFDPDDPQAPPVAADQASGVSSRDVQIALDLFDRFRNVDDERSELQRLLGLNLFIAGEVWLVGTDESVDYATPTNPSGEQWRVFSVEEIKVSMDGRWYVEPWEGATDSEREYLAPDTATLLRCYRRHGRRREYPDGPMRSANLVCEELLAATQAILGSLRSRLPAGILPIPDDIEDETENDEDAEGADADGMDPVLRKLLTHFSAAKRDPRSAAALVPFLLRVPKDIIDKLKLVDVARAFPKEELDLIAQLTRRLANAMDVPTEEAAGTKGESNHWNIFELDADGVQMYVEPYTALYVNPIVSRIWRPRLEMAGVARPELWTIGIDPTDVMAHPDMSNAAIAGYGLNPPIVSGVATAKAIGFSEDEMPDEEELARVMDWRARTTPGFGAGSEDEMPASPGEPPPEPEASSVETPAPAPMLAAAAPEPERIGERWGRIEAQLTRDVLVAADAAVRRVLERAQNRVRTEARKAPLGPSEAEKRLGQRIRAQAKGTAPELLAATLGVDLVHVLGLNDDDLFNGELSALEVSWLAWLARARGQALRELRRSGVGPPPVPLAEWEAEAQRHAEESWTLLEAGLAALAARLLFAPASPQTPDQGEWDSTISVPAGLVRDALSEAGGGASSRSDRVLGYLAGADFEALLDATPGVEADGWIWEAGFPERPFDPHQDLAGIEFSSWRSIVLEASADEFPYVSYYAPGDHDGCQCVATPTATLAAEEAA